MYIIVGIDPGIRTGYAALDLTGKLIAAGCTKQKSMDSILQVISEIGTPSVVATDVKPAPEFVRRVAVRFNARLFTPSKSLSKHKKRMIGKDLVNPHIRDAFSAAISAYRHFSNRLTRIEKTYPEKADYFKHLMLRGFPVGKLK